MKRRNVFFFVVGLIVASGASLMAGETYMVFFTGNYLVPADSHYKDIYGSGMFYPELMFGSKVYKNITLWAGFGHLSASGTTLPGLQQEARSRHSFLSLGTGYSGKISKSMIYKLNVGLFYAFYKEEALEEKISGSVLGYRADFSIIYTLSRTLFTEFSLGYLYAADRVGDVSIKPGGFKGGVGLGIWF